MSPVLVRDSSTRGPVASTLSRRQVYIKILKCFLLALYASHRLALQLDRSKIVGEGNSFILERIEGHPY